MISDKTMIVYARAAIDFRTLAQYGSHDGNILQYMEHALYQMDMLKSAFRKYRINTRDAHYSFACMEPTTGDESCIQMDRQGAFCHFPRIKSMPISKSRLPAFNTPDKCNGNGGADLTWPNETSHGCC
jgi:hypothetical protein